MDSTNALSSGTFKDVFIKMRIIIDHLEQIFDENNNNKKRKDVASKTTQTSSENVHHADVHVQTDDADVHHVDVVVQTDTAHEKDQENETQKHENEQDQDQDNHHDETDENATDIGENWKETVSLPASEEAEPEELEELERVILERMKQGAQKDHKEKHGDDKAVQTSKFDLEKIKLEIVDENDEMNEVNEEINNVTNEANKEGEKEGDNKAETNKDMDHTSEQIDDGGVETEEVNNELENAQAVEEQEFDSSEENDVVKKETEASTCDVEQTHQTENMENNENGEDTANDTTDNSSHNPETRNNLKSSKRSSRHITFNEEETEYITYETEEYATNQETNYMNLSTKYNDNVQYIYGDVEYYDDVYTPEERCEILRRKRAHRFGQISRKQSKPLEHAFHAPIYYDGTLAWEEVQYLRRRNYNVNFTGKIRCAFCFGKHYSDSCRRLKSSAERRERLHENGRCLICLNTDHPTKRCKRPRCAYCEIAEGRNLVLNQDAHHSSVCAWPDKTEEWIQNILLRNAGVVREV